MMELLILALASITIMDVSFDDGMHIDGVAENNAKIELHAVYITTDISFGLHCEDKRGCVKFVNHDEILRTTKSASDGSFKISASNYQIKSSLIPTSYYISVDNQQDKHGIGPLYYSIKDTVKSYASGIGTHAEIENTLLIFLDKRDALRTTDYSITEIPEWFRHTAGYWADNQTTNADFLNAINYLVNEKIIEIHN